VSTPAALRATPLTSCSTSRACGVAAWGGCLPLVWHTANGCADAPCRTNAETAYIISPAVGANFAMYIATMRANASAGQPPQGVERYPGASCSSSMLWAAQPDGLYREPHILAARSVGLRLRRFVFVLDGLLTAAEGAAGSATQLHAGDFAYIPPDSAVRCSLRDFGSRSWSCRPAVPIHDALSAIVQVDLQQRSRLPRL